MVLRLFLCFMLFAPLARADTSPPGTQCSSGAFGQIQCIRPDHFVFDTCQAIEAFANDSGLDPGFFARLIWQESRFDPNALSHANAQGVAQFIPSTAEIRGLLDPYNPAQALEYSAEYLGELTRRYGNHGLAAVAYNGGERRADGLVSKSRGLATETINYVKIITGLPAETWRDAPPKTHDFRLQKDKPFAPACHELALKRRLTAYPEPEPPEAAAQPWGVQMAFGVTKQRALAQFKSRSQRCAKAVGGETPALIWEKSRASPKGGYYIVRLGRSDRDAAWKLCKKIKAQGCICAVYRNR